MISQTWQQVITMHILSNISRSKDNQKMSFGRLLVYNMRNVFLEKSFKKLSRQSSLRHFYKNTEHISESTV